MADDKFSGLTDFFNEHEIKAVYLPGVILFFTVLLLFFFDAFKWSITAPNTLGSFVVVILAPYLIGTIVNQVGRLIEKFIIERLFDLDLKRIGNIHKIVSEKKATLIITHYNLSTSKTNYWLRLREKSSSENEWQEEIRKIKDKLKDGVKKKQGEYNSTNKFLRGMFADSSIMFFTSIFLGKYIHGVSTNIIIIATIVIGILSFWGMRQYEKRELQKIYDEALETFK